MTLPRIVVSVWVLNFLLYRMLVPLKANESTDLYFCWAKFDLHSFHEFGATDSVALDRLNARAYCFSAT